MLDHSARSVWSSTRVDSDYWHLVTDLGTESFSLHLLGIVALWLPHPCTIGSPIRFLRAASVNRTEWSRASFEILRSTIILEKRNEGKENVFFFSSIEIFFFCLYSIFFFFVLIKISEEKENFFFVYLRFWKFWKFWKKGNFFFIHFREKFQREKERKRNFFFLLWNENFKNLPFKRDLILWKNGCTRRSGKKKKESAFT